jgi:hypothetical protein
MIPPALAHAQFVPVARGEKSPRLKGWPTIRLTPDQLADHLAADGNVAIRLGSGSGDIVDIDLDAPETVELADRYLPATDAVFGRPGKPRSHRLYIAPRATYAAFADPLDGSTLLELRADGREGGAHLTVIPPSVTGGERREWCGDSISLATISAAVLARRAAWLAIGALVARHVSRYAAERPGPDLASLLWEADPALGRPAYRWLGERAPDEPRRHSKPWRDMTNAELRLAEITADITNNCDWLGWNRIGMALYAASGGSEEGFIAFDDLSARSVKYDPHTTRERWNNYHRSPPSRIGIGTLLHLARGDQS